MNRKRIHSILTGAVAAAGVIGMTSAGLAADTPVIATDLNASQTVSARDLAARGAVPNRAVRAGMTRQLASVSGTRMSFPTVVLGQTGYAIAGTQSTRQALQSNAVANAQLPQLAYSADAAAGLLPMENGFVGTPELAAQSGVNGTTQSAVILGNQTITSGGLAPASPVFPLEPSIIGNTSTGGVAGPATTPGVINRNTVSSNGAIFQAGTSESAVTAPAVTGATVSSGSLRIGTIGVAGPVTVGKQ